MTGAADGRHRSDAPTDGPEGRRRAPEAIRYSPPLVDPACLPNVLYIGLARAGSTWLSEVLRHHPDVFVPEVKDLYFFDRSWSQGPDWYASWFRAGRDHAVRMEFSHDYLHVPFVPQRIRSVIPDARFLVTLREPVDWVLSNYRNMQRNGAGGGDIGWTISRHVGLVGSGLHAAYVRHWFDVFDTDRFSFLVFDDLREDPAAFHADVLATLGLRSQPLPELDDEAQNAASVARWAPAARALRAGGQAVRKAGRPEIVGKVKRSKLVRQALYRRSQDSVDVPEDVTQGLRDFFRDDVHQISELTGIDLVARWGY